LLFFSFPDPRKVVTEHSQLCKRLEAAGITVVCLSHQASHGTPDATFVNNWFSTHPGKGMISSLRRWVLVLQTCELSGVLSYENGEQAERTTA
jgi:N-dimethylarginine dimethylaminohydrolase